MRTVIYARFSSDAQRHASIEDQIRVCRARAEREGWAVIEEFADHAISGTILQRPAYQAMMAAIGRGGIGLVLAESLDRISRDPEHIAGFHKQARYAGVRIVTLQEGDISELQIAFSGTMAALYVRDLAAKTHRGLEGRIRAGRSIGIAPYGYRILRRMGPDGEPERGLREIDPEQAAIVRRIFTEFLGGRSPRHIAQALNAEGVPSPGGAIWYDSSIRGRPSRHDGLLRNPLYAGRLVWNRRRNTKEPFTGSRVRKPNLETELVTHTVPELAIIDPPVWQAAQDRLRCEAAIDLSAPPTSPADARFWQRRRPRHLLTGKVVCGLCGRGFARIGQDYLACRAALEHGCRNTVRPRMSRLEAQVIDALARRLMQPKLVEAFVRVFTDTWKELAAGATEDTAQIQVELRAVERQIANLVDALAEGLRAEGIQQRLAGLEQRRTALAAKLASPPPAMPKIPSDLARVYQAAVADLAAALGDPEDAEAREAARALIDKIVVTPPASSGDPPDIEVIGDLANLLQTAGLVPKTKEEQAHTQSVLNTLLSSVKEGPGAWTPIPGKWAGLGGAQLLPSMYWPSAAAAGPGAHAGR